MLRLVVFLALIQISLVYSAGSSSEQDDPITSQVTNAAAAADFSHLRIYPSQYDEMTRNLCKCLL